MRLFRIVCLCLFGVLAPSAGAAPAKLDNAACLRCHDGNKTLQVPDPAEEGETRPLAAVIPDRFGQGVHARMACVDCHGDIVDAASPHRKTEARKPDCAECHEKLWLDAQRDGTAGAHPRLGVVARNIAAYRQSFHAKENAEDPERPNADCHECHDSHSFNVPADRKSPQYAAWRLGIPALCGKCHEDQLDEYSESIHGTEILEEHNAKSAVCTDCHTTHEITGTSLTGFKLLNPEECGNCHKNS